MKKLLFTILMIMPFIGIAQIDILNDLLIEEKYPNKLGAYLDIDRLTSDDPNFSGAASFEYVYWGQGELGESDIITVEYYLGDKDEDGNHRIVSPRSVRFRLKKNDGYETKTKITFYRNGKIKEIKY
tara:strand:- start:536 stop:916 length:381 start_codon:yes stop_codon:yes gene_type:complete